MKPSLNCMKINLLYFAHLRERLGIDSEELSLEGEAVSLADVLAVLRARDGIWKEALATGNALSFAVRLEFADENAIVRDNDEVAIFPPVTGG